MQEVDCAPHVEHPHNLDGPGCASGKCQCRDARKDGCNEITIRCRKSEGRRKRGGYDPRDQKAEPNKPKCVGNDQGNEGIRSAHDPESRPDVHLRDNGESKLIKMLSPNNASLLMDRLLSCAG